MAQHRIRMMKLLHYLIFFFLFFDFQHILSFLNQNEIDVSFDLIKNLKIRQCLLIGDHNNIILLFKTFSSINIPTTYLNRSRLTTYVENSNNTHFHTGLIMKDKNLFTSKRISETLKAASIKNIQTSLNS